MANFFLRWWGLKIEPFVRLNGDALWCVTDGLLPLRIESSYVRCVRWAVKRCVRL